MKDVDWESEVGSSIFDVVIEKNPNAAQEFFRNSPGYKQIAKVAQNRTTDVIIRCNQYRQSAWDNAHAMQSDVWEWRGEASRYAAYSAPEKQTPIRKKVHAIRTAIKKQYCAEQQKKYLDEIVELQQTAHNNRYHPMRSNRLHALDGACKNPFSRQKYHFTVSDELLNFAEYYDIPREQLTHCLLNAYEYQLHQEFIEQLTHAVALDHKFNHSYEVNVLLDILGEGIAAGVEANHLHSVAIATSWADYGWGVIDVGRGFFDGVLLGVQRSANIFIHPIETIDNIALGIGTACVLVGKTMGTMFLIDDLITLNEYDEVQKQIDAAMACVDAIKKQCTTKLQAMSMREKTKHIVAFITESIITKKALTTIFSACDKMGPLLLDAVASLSEEAQLMEIAVAAGGNVLVEIPKASASTIASFMDGDMPKIAGGIAAANAVADEVKELTADNNANAAAEQEPVNPAENITITVEEKRALLEAIERATKESLDQELEILKKPFDGIRKGFDKCANQEIKIPYEHIFTPECKFARKGTLQKISGFHHDPKSLLKESNCIKFGNTITDKHGCYRVNLIINGQSWPKSFFPTHWSKEKVISKIYEAYDDFVAKGALFKNSSDGKYIIQGLTEEGIAIEMFVTPNGKITTAYPNLLRK